MFCICSFVCNYFLIINNQIYLYNPKQKEILIDLKYRQSTMHNKLKDRNNLKLSSVDMFEFFE